MIIVRFTFSMRRRVDKCKDSFRRIELQSHTKRSHVLKTESICLWMRQLFASVGHLAPYSIDIF